MLPLDPHPPQKGNKKKERTSSENKIIESESLSQHSSTLKVFSFGQAISPSYAIANVLVMLDSK